MEDRSCDGNPPNPLESAVASPAVPATDRAEKKHASEENPVISTRSGRIVHKPARYQEEGESF